MAIIYILGFIAAQNINIHMSQVVDHKQDNSVIWDTNCDEGGFKQKLHRNTANQIIAFNNSIFFFFSSHTKTLENSFWLWTKLLNKPRG